MWKDWFYYTRGERRVIILLLLSWSVIIALLVSEPSHNGGLNIEDNTLALVDSLSRKTKVAEQEHRGNSPEYVKTASDGKPRKNGNKPSFKPLYKKQEKFPEGTLVDVNTADTTLLKKVPGIGSVISRNIVKYRERLGGFYDVNQLLEVRYVDSSLLKWFKVGTGVYRKLKVNTDNVDVLKNHPYMNYYRAKAIIDYRNKRGKIDDYPQISFLKEFSGKENVCLKHYFDYQ